MSRVALACIVVCAFSTIFANDGDSLNFISDAHFILAAKETQAIPSD